MNDSIDVFSVSIEAGHSINFDFVDPVVTIVIYQRGKTLYSEKIPSDIDVTITNDKFITEYFETKCPSYRTGYITATLLFITLICLICILSI